jgi:signal peptide peptidase SppA
LIYEFNNLDKITKPSTYIEREESDEFDELEEFVNMVINSFVGKYDKVGVLLKISSPGGSAFKFEHAYLNLLRLKEKKIELIGLVDKMAASGGYMLAMACDQVICSRFATIGSVGVIAQLYNWSGLNKKIGLEEKTWTTGTHKNLFPLGSDYTDEDFNKVNEMIMETFEVFKQIVLSNRKFTPEQFEQIIKAKTFHGSQALELNMVDSISMSEDYFESLVEKKYELWICSKEETSKSIVNSLLYDGIKFVGNSIKTSLIANISNGTNQNLNKQKLLDKKFTGIKLL